MQPAPPQPPDLPGISINTPDGRVTVTGAGPATASQIYDAQVAARREIRNQLERVEDTRNDIRNNLQREELNAVDRTGLESRLKETDLRIADLEKQVSAADAAVARAAAIPGAIVEKPQAPREPQYDETIAIIGSCFTIFVLAPLAIAKARGIWKRGKTVVAPIPKEVTDRLDQMGEAVDSIALEVERIGEGQRFITKVMGERQLGAGPAQPIVVNQGEKVEAHR